MKHIRRMLIALASVSLVLLNVGTVGATGSITWSGTDCLGSAQDCTWSNANNWVGGVAPGAGDSIVFNNSTLTDDEVVVDDIASTTVFANLTFQGSTAYAFLILGNNASPATNSILKINGNVTDSIVSGTHPTLSGIYGNFVNTSASPTYTMSDAFQFGFGAEYASDPTLAQAATASFSTGTATFVGASAATDVVNYAALTGSHNIVFNLSADGSFQQLTASPAFTGALTVSTGTLDYAPYLAPTTMPDPFSGASAVTVQTGGGFSIQDPNSGDQTFAEPFTLGGNGTANCINGGATVNCGALFANIHPDSTLTLSGAVVLSADSQINSTGTVKLTGALSGAHALTAPYIGLLTLATSANTSSTTDGDYGSLPSFQAYTNDPGTLDATTDGGTAGGTTTDPTVDPATVPAVPDTGMVLVHAKPLMTLLSTTVCAVMLLLLAELSKPIQKKVRV